MTDYLITVWDIDGKYAYKLRTNRIEEHREILKQKYNRFIIEECLS